MTYGNFGGNQIALVQDENKMLVWCLLPEVLFNRSTPCSEGIPSVQDV